MVTIYGCISQIYHILTIIFTYTSSISIIELNHGDLAHFPRDAKPTHASTHAHLSSASFIRWLRIVGCSSLSLALR